MRRHTDGPWEQLLLTSPSRAVVSEEGALHVIATSRHLPETQMAWFEQDEQRTARIPVEGHVVGTASSFGGAVAWTREERLYQYLGVPEPVVVGEFDDLESAAIWKGGLLFASLGDGRVMVRGASADSWQRGLDRDATDDWIEIPELRGAMIFTESYHGCALFEDGRVACFGASDGFVGEGQRERLSLTPVPQLRGARTLFLRQRRTCALMPRDRVVCLGEEASATTGTPKRNGAAVLNLRRLLRTAQELPPLL